MISALSDEQEEWVKSAGFGSLVDFELWEIPQRLAYKVLEAFDEKKMHVGTPKRQHKDN